MEAILQKFGPDGDAMFKYKKISLYLRKWEDNPPQRRCHECHDPGHLKYECPRLAGAHPSRQLQRNLNPAPNGGGEPRDIAQVPHNLQSSERYIEMKLDSWSARERSTLNVYWNSSINNSNEPSICWAISRKTGRMRCPPSVTDLNNK